MNKQDLLRQIAQTGYNAGFGAKRHFATYDILEKYPGWVSFLSIALGIFALVFDVLGTKAISAALLVFGITTFYTAAYDREKLEYEKSGKLLTGIFDELKSLYFRVRAKDDSNFLDEASRLSELQAMVHASSISKQLVFSNWYAHYKFFWEQQIQWIEEELRFSFWRDKVPLNLMISAGLVIIGATYLGLRHFMRGGF